VSRLHYLIATCVLALTVGGANANTITAFDVGGTFSAPVTFSGTLTVDVTTGTVTAVDIVILASRISRAWLYHSQMALADGFWNRLIQTLSYWALTSPLRLTRHR
jgi:hypothetical protein